METPKWQYPSRFARSPDTPVSSASDKSVCLLDWWVVKPEGEGLLVSGFAATGSGETRLFTSALIAKRITTTVLEAVDGIHIRLTGLINRSQAHQNGLSNSFCQHFRFGFPFDWEEYSTQCVSSKTGDLLNEDGSGEQDASSSSGHALLGQLDSLPVSEMRNFIMSLSEHSENCLLDSILGELDQNISQHTTRKSHSATTTKGTRAVTDSGKDDEARMMSHPKAKVDRNDVVDRNRGEGVVTRSMVKKSRRNGNLSR